MALFALVGLNSVFNVLHCCVYHRVYDVFSVFGSERRVRLVKGWVQFGTPHKRNAQLSHARAAARIAGGGAAPSADAVLRLRGGWGVGTSLIIRSVMVFLINLHLFKYP